MSARPRSPWRPRSNKPEKTGSAPGRRRPSKKTTNARKIGSAGATPKNSKPLKGPAYNLLRVIFPESHWKTGDKNHVLGIRQNLRRHQYKAKQPIVAARAFFSHLCEQHASDRSGGSSQIKKCKDQLLKKPICIEIQNDITKKTYMYFGQSEDVKAAKTLPYAELTGDKESTYIKRVVYTYLPDCEQMPFITYANNKAGPNSHTVSVNSRTKMAVFKKIRSALKKHVGKPIKTVKKSKKSKKGKNSTKKSKNSTKKKKKSTKKGTSGTKKKKKSTKKGQK